MFRHQFHYPFIEHVAFLRQSRASPACERILLRKVWRQLINGCAYPPITIRGAEYDTSNSVQQYGPSAHETRFERRIQRHLVQSGCKVFWQRAQGFEFSMSIRFESWHPNRILALGYDLIIQADHTTDWEVSHAAGLVSQFDRSVQMILISVR